LVKNILGFSSTSKNFGQKEQMKERNAAENPKNKNVQIYKRTQRK